MEPADDFPCRNELWLVKPPGAIGTEQGVGKFRPGLIISGDDLNRSRNAVTVALLTEYGIDQDHRYDRLPRSIVVLQFQDHASALRPRGHGFYQTRQGEIRPGREWKWGKRVIVDCGQLFTLRVPPLEKRANDNSILWSGPRAKLADSLAVEDVNSGLQAVLGGGIYATHQAADLRDPYRPLTYSAGDVISIRLYDEEVYCLVVSSASIDLLREHIYRNEDDRRRPGRKLPRPRGRMDHGPWPLGHLTIVPLIPDRNYDRRRSTYVFMEVQRRPFIAICPELYTIDWRARGSQKVDVVDDDTMNRVWTGIRYSLDLPVLTVE